MSWVIEQFKIYVTEYINCLLALYIWYILSQSMPVHYFSAEAQKGYKETVWDFRDIIKKSKSKEIQAKREINRFLPHSITQNEPTADFYTIYTFSVRAKSKLTINTLENIK